MGTLITMRSVFVLLVLTPLVYSYSSGSSSTYASGSGSVAPTPTPGTAKKTIQVVKGDVKLTGITAAQFNVAAVKTAFKTTVAGGMSICGTTGTANCTAADVTITSAARRRAEVTVKFYIETTSAAKAA